MKTINVENDTKVLFEKGLIRFITITGKMQTRNEFVRYLVYLLRLF